MFILEGFFLFVLDSSGHSLLKMGVNVEVSERRDKLSRHLSVDKEAKELSNLLKTLSVKDEVSASPTDPEDDWGVRPCLLVLNAKIVW